MKKLLYIALLLTAFISLYSKGLAQGAPPFRLQEIDGSPSVLSPTVIKLTNGTLSCSGKTCTITISGGGGGSPGGSNTQLQYNNAGSFGGITGATTNGTIVTLTSPVFVTPALGTPASGVLTNATGLPISTGVSGLGTGVATALGVNTGSAGAVVLFNGAGGTPSTLTLTNATGLPPTTGISGWPANAAGVLTNNGSGTLSWTAAGGGITIGTTAITSGTNTRVLYNNAGVVGEYAVTGTGNAVLSASPTLTGTVGMAAMTATGTIVQTSASATAFESGPNGSTNPVFRLVNNVASAATGLSITGNAAGSGVDVTALSSGATENLNLSHKGTGSTCIGGTINTGACANPNASLFRLQSGWEIAGASYNSINLTNAVLRWPSNTPDVSITRSAAGTLRLTNGSTGAGNLIIGTSAGAIGTSGAGVLAMALSTAPTTSPADVAQLWAADMQATAGNHGFHIRNEINTAALILPGVRYKTDTGDPTDTFEGMMVINTFDNTFKVYAEGAWRTITTW